MLPAKDRADEVRAEEMTASHNLIYSPYRRL